MAEPEELAGTAVRPVVAGPGTLYLYIEGAPSPETSRMLGAWRRALVADRPPALTRAIHDVIPGYASLLIAYRASVSPERVRAWALSLRPPEDDAPTGRTHDIPVAYGQDADRSELEASLGLSFEEIVRRHAGVDYTVAFLGFTAGFPYLLGLPDELHAPRRRRPRERTPAGAVAIAGAQAGIYPSESPGGWWVLGRTPTVLFDPTREPPALFAPGDTVHFHSTGGDDREDDRDGDPEAESPEAAPPPSTPERTAERQPQNTSSAPGVHVTDAWPRSVSLQGPPRYGVGHLGMAEAGALDPIAFEQANAILGNPAGAIALEAVAQPVGLRAVGDLRAVVTGGGLSLHLDGTPLRRWRAFDWPDGASLELIPDRHVAGSTSYVAVAGGFEAQGFGGSRSTDARAGVGGVGRFLTRGDQLALDEPGVVRVERAWPGTPRYPDRIVLRIHPGPQADPDALRALLNGSFHVAVLDRTGARLDGPTITLGQHETLSEGSPAGAIQIPPDGQPIVLLADRGRTGGYAKPAIVDPRDLWQLAQADARTEIWFEAATATPGTRPVH